MMKITLNLATSRSRYERYSLAWAAPAALAAFVVLVFLSLSAWDRFGQYRKVHRSLRELQESEQVLARREMALRNELGRAEFREVSRQAQYVNSLIDRKQLSLTELVEKVSKLLPAGVRLAGLALLPGPGEPVVRFVIVGNNEEAAENFLGNLEDSPDFKNVTILSQGIEEGGAGGPGATLACSAQYVGGKPR